MDLPSRSDDQRKFTIIADLAVRKKAITRKEVSMISRPGTRKHGYWGRHLRDLCEYLVERKQIDNEIREAIERYGSRRTITNCETSSEIGTGNGIE